MTDRTAMFQRIVIVMMLGAIFGSLVTISRTLKDIRYEMQHKVE